MKELAGTILRLILKAGGGVLVGKGLMDEGALETIIGAALTIFGTAWGIYEARSAAQLRQAIEPVKPAPPTVPPIHFWLIAGLLAFYLVGCATPQRPPSVAERKYFDIKTNVVEVVTTVTNIVPATATTVAAIRVEPVTNRVEEYDFAPNANAGAIASTSGAVASIWNPVAGGVVGAAISGFFGLWGLLRSKKRETAHELTAIELAQIIQTGREILLKLPEGEKYEAEYRAWMVRHQAQTGVIGQVAELVAAAVDDEKAKGAAQTIINLMRETQPK